MRDDWRITNQMKYLFGKELLKSVFRATKENDHEHCEFCWDKFSASAEDLHEGYTTTDHYRWICDTCYEDFKEMFQWKVVEVNPSEQQGENK